MICPNCQSQINKNTYACPKCKHSIPGGIVFVSGISGSGVSGYLSRVAEEARNHDHVVFHHNVGEIMRRYAESEHLNVQWDRVLDADDEALRMLRVIAMQELIQAYNENPHSIHLADLHLSFRWRSFLTKGFEPHILDRFRPITRLFINIVEDLPKIQERLEKTSWGRREILELLVWRDEELLLSDFFADAAGLQRAFAVAAAEPAAEVEKLIWHPEFSRVYLSFPITNILTNEEAKAEISSFRDRIREFLTVFDPYASKDYDETYKRDEMKLLRKEVGDITEERDFRFIDQADAVVVYYPRIVESKGVDAELNHARRTGKPIFMYRPPGKDYGGPFVVAPDHLSTDPEEFLKFLRNKFAPKPTGGG